MKERYISRIPIYRYQKRQRLERQERSKSKVDSHVCVAQLRDCLFGVIIVYVHAYVSSTDSGSGYLLSFPILVGRFHVLHVHIGYPKREWVFGRAC